MSSQATTQLQPTGKTALATLFDANAPIQKILAKAESSIGAALRGPIEAPALIRSALLQVAMTPALQKVAATADGKMSIVQAVMQAASLGLMVGGPAGEAALVPYKGVAKLIPMVRGLATLAIRSGSVLAISPRVVFEGDDFRVLLGTEDKIHHIPLLTGTRDDDRKITVVYALFKMAGGALHFDWMTRDEVDRVRATSKSKDEGPWVEWYGEQAKKTVVKRAAKMVPLSPEFRAAVELDNRFETGTINEPSGLLDSMEDVTSHVMDATRERANGLRERLTKEERAEIDRQAAMDGLPEDRTDA